MSDRWIHRGSSWHRAHCKSESLDPFHLKEGAGSSGDLHRENKLVNYIQNKSSKSEKEHGRGTTLSFLNQCVVKWEVSYSLS